MLPAGFKIFTYAEVPATMAAYPSTILLGRNAMSQWEEQLKTLEKRIEAIRGYL
jgi:hypothetical protein